MKSKFVMLTEELERLERRLVYIQKDIAHQHLLMKNAKVRRTEIISEMTNATSTDDGGN